MSRTPATRTLYLDFQGEAVFANLHVPDAGGARDTAVVLCPPFGWDEVCSYRCLRMWAAQLAAAGYACIRISFPSTGDSGGMPRDPGRLDAWTAAVAGAAHSLRDAAGTRRTVAIGMGLGGLIALRAAALGAELDDLVLWATPATGRSLLRELRAFSRVEAGFFEGLEQPPPLPEGELEVGGFLLSAETASELGAFDATALDLHTDREPRHALLLDRDGIAVEARLVKHLRECGVDVTEATGGGYAAMTSHPQSALPPLETIRTVQAWLDLRSEPLPADAPGAGGSLERLGTGATAQIRVNGGDEIRETALTIEQPFGFLSAILAEPVHGAAGDLCVLLLNAGAIRRIGPNRMWVEAARRWAASGVPTVRLDVEGIGEADGEANPYADDGLLYVPELIPQVLATLDALQARGIGKRFLLAGLCAGAYWSFHAALLDQRVSAIVMVNPRALIWDAGLAPTRDLRKLFSEPFDFEKVRRNATPERRRAVIRLLLSAPMRASKRLRDRRAGFAGGRDQVDDALERLHASGKPTTFLFSEDEPLLDELVRSGRLSRISAWQNFSIEHVGVRDHTLRPTWSQGQAHVVLDRALERELRA